MTTMNISLPDSLKSFVDEQVDLRGYGTTTHALTGIAGRGTAESKSNDVINRVLPGEVGMAIEFGRPTLGMDLANIQKVTRAMAQAGFMKIEPENPFNDMIQNYETGDLKPELMGEKVLSAIMEFKITPDRFGLALRTIKEAAKEVDSVFVADVLPGWSPDSPFPRKFSRRSKPKGIPGGRTLKSTWAWEGPTRGKTDDSQLAPGRTPGPVE